MVRLDKVKALIWKELRELSRDRKTILTTIIFPLISLPSIGLLTVLLIAQQPIVIAIVVEDLARDNSLAMQLQDILSNTLSQKGYVTIAMSDRYSAIYNSTIDIVVVIPKGFSENATSYDKVAYVEIVRRAGVNVQRADQAESEIRGVISWFSDTLSRIKIERLANMAGLFEYNVDAIRNPVTIGAPIIVTPGGQPAGPEDVLKAFVARLLVLSFAFVVTPASSFVIDGVIGERERKTMEMLLSSPAGLTEIFSAKLIAATLVGLIAAIADMLGLVVYFGLMLFAIGGVFMAVFHPVLILLHAVTAFFTILATISMAMPFISRTRGIRSASNIAGIITGVGIIFFIAGWIVDIPRLNPNIRIPLMIVPYTHSILVIQNYIYS
ncbi:MAG: ABC transporter permease, partial [Desulfurococcaceae archaeon]